MANITQITPTVKPPDVSGRVAGFGFIPELRKPQEPRRPQRGQPPLLDVRAAGGFGAGIASVLGTAANIAIEVRQKNLRLEDSNKKSQATFDFKDTILIIDNEERKVTRVNQQEYKNAVMSRGVEVIEDIANSKDFNDPFVKSQFVAEARSTLSGVLGRVDARITKRNVVKGLTNLDKQRQIGDNNIAEGLSDADGEYNIFALQVEDGVSNGLFGPDVELREKAGAAQLYRVGEVLRDFRANPDATIKALEGNGYRSHNEPILNIVGNERVALIEDLKKKRKVDHSLLRSTYLKNADDQIQWRGDTGGVQTVYAQQREAMKLIDPKLVKEVDIQDAIALDFHDAKEAAAVLVPFDAETGEGGLSAMLANMKFQEQFLKPTKDDLPDTGKVKKRFLEQYQAEMNEVKKELAQNGAAFTDRIIRNNPDILPDEMTVEQYADLPAAEKSAFREQVWDSLGVPLGQRRYLQDDEIAQFANNLRTMPKPVDRMAFMDKFYHDLTPERFYQELDNLMDADLAFTDFVLMTMVDVPQNARAEAVRLLDTMHTSGITEERAKKDAGSVRWKEIENATATQYATKYGGTFAGSRPNTRSAWLTTLRLATAQKNSETNGSADDDALEVYNAFLGNHFDTARIGHGVFNAVIPKRVPFLKPSTGVVNRFSFRTLDVETVNLAADWYMENLLHEFKPDPGADMYTEGEPKLYEDNLKFRTGGFVTLDRSLPDQNFKRGEGLMLINDLGEPVVNEKGEFFVIPYDNRLFTSAEIQAKKVKKKEREFTREFLPKS